MSKKKRFDRPRKRVDKKPDAVAKTLEGIMDRNPLSGARAGHLPPTVMMPRETVLKTYDGIIPEPIALPKSDYEYVFEEVEGHPDMILVEPRLKKAWVTTGTAETGTAKTSKTGTAKTSKE